LKIDEWHSQRQTSSWLTVWSNDALGDCYSQAYGSLQKMWWIST